MTQKPRIVGIMLTVSTDADVGDLDAAGWWQAFFDRCAGELGDSLTMTVYQASADVIQGLRERDDSDGK
jgi:hypothetical protein